jgi:hypothetical protein
VQTETIENDELIVQSDKSLQTVAREIVRIYPSLKLDLEDIFRFKIGFKPTVILIKDRSDFRKMVGNDLVVAVAIPRNNLIIIDNSKMKTHPFTLETTLKHELCHLLLHHYVAGGPLPKWLNEGISQWVTGGVSEMIIGENKDFLKQAVLSGRLIPLDNLNMRFPGNGKSLRLAYQQSKSFVEFMENEYGVNGIIGIFNYLREGENLDSALHKALAVSIYELERDWKDSLRKKYTWFTFFSGHLYEILFSLAALFLVAGFIQFLIRKRAYKDEEEDKEDID